MLSDLLIETLLVDKATIWYLMIEADISCSLTSPLVILVSKVVGRTSKAFLTN